MSFMQMKRATKFVADQLKPKAGDRVLDLGCGTGNLERYLASLVGPTGFVLGVDPDVNRTDVAKDVLKDLSNVRIETGSVAEATRFGPFDIVVAVEVLHWVPKEKHHSLFSGVFDSLKPGGVFGFTALASPSKDREKQISEDLFFSQYGGSLLTLTNDIGWISAPASYWCDIAELQGFHIIQHYENVEVFSFPSIVHLLKWLEATTVGFFCADKVDQEELKQLMIKHGHDEDNPVSQKIPSLQVVIQKPLN